MGAQQRVLREEFLALVDLCGRTPSQEFLQRELAA